MCAHIPSTLHIDDTERANHQAVILASCFFLESFIHAKEKVCSKSIVTRYCNAFLCLMCSL